MIFETYKDGYIKSDIVLSIGMLVSNHIQYIEQCMKGLKPLLDAVPSELIIIDTVGPDKSDGSIDICRKYTDKIYRFEWCNDFSKARNEMLKYARGEWFMYQDDDEWFDDVTEFIRFFKSDEIHKYNSGFYITKDYYRDGGASFGLAGRMVRRRPDSHFVGRVHEGFNEANIPGKKFESYTHHYGYAYVNEEERHRKSERNLTLLDAELEENGISPRLCAQKVQELLALPSRASEGYRLAVEYVDELYKMDQAGNSCTQWLICAQTRYFLMNKDGEGLVKKTKELRDKYKMSHYAMLVLSEVEVDGVTHYCDSADYLQLIKDDVKLYVELVDYFARHPDEQLIETNLDFPRFITGERQNAMLIAGAQVANRLSEFDDAFTYWKRVDWSIVIEPERYKDVLLFTLQRMADSGPLSEYYRHFMNPALFEPGYEKYLPEDLRRLTGLIQK